MNKKITKAVTVALLVFTGSAWAEPVIQSWLSAYPKKASSSVGQSASSSGKKIHYTGTKSLRTSQLVQTLTGMGTLTSPGTILSSRVLVMTSGIDGALLPDGSNLSPYLQAWSQNYVPDVSLYAITYRSRNANGAPTNLSGLVVVPENGLTGNDPDSVLVYMHATTTQDNNAPSERSQEAYAVITAFAHQSTVLAMPDYLGYGVNRGNHPYSMGKLNAPSGKGMIVATRELMQRLKRNVGSKIYITGYSEGGGNALWLTRYLEESKDPNLQPTLSAPMSGPYDLSGATAESFIGQQPPITYEENVNSKPTLLSFAAVSTSRITRQPLTSLLQDALAEEARGQFPGTLSDTNLGTRLLTTSINDYPYINYLTLSPDPQQLLQPSLVAAIQQHDLSDPAIRLWTQNDNLVWSPQSPVMLFGILQDELVPFAAKSYPVPAAWLSAPVSAATAPYTAGNSENLMASMRARGIGPQRVGWTAFNGAVQSLTNPVIMSHAAGMLPCSILAQSYFFNPTTAIPQLKDPQP